MSIDRFVRRNWFACLLVVLHTLMIVGLGWAHLDGAAHDMSPAFLLILAVRYIDAPVLWLLNAWFQNSERVGTNLAVVFLLGGAFWFVVGTLVTYTCRGVRHLFVGGRQAANGV